MNRKAIYTFDGHLDDSENWVAADRKCGQCGYEYMVVYREDKDAACPRCVISDRWVRDG